MPRREDSLKEVLPRLLDTSVSGRENTCVKTFFENERFGEREGMQ
jgi:hypothetical protein